MALATQRDHVRILVRTAAGTWDQVMMIHVAAVPASNAEIQTHEISK
jgi:hypothetical protein